MKTTKVAETSLPTPLGTFRLFGFRSEPKTENVLALVMGKLNPDEAALVRIHSQCLTGDVFGSERCDCGDQLHFALSTIAELMPTHRVVGIHAVDLVWGLGTLHCLTQQQPAKGGSARR